MKAFFLYIALGAVAINIVGNIAANTAQGLQEAQEQRTERLCGQNAAYCG